MGTVTINPELFRNKEIAEEAIAKLINTKRELDDFIDTLKLLSDSGFRKELDKGIREYKKGEVIKGSIDDLRKEIA
jgi:hypothetical protein